LKEGIPVYSPDFPRIYRDHVFRQAVKEVTEACSGCMYGSYPEMTISMRFLAAKMDRFKLFLAAPPPKPWPVSYEKMLAISQQIREEKAKRQVLAA
jgi:hypothetical protein